MSESIIQVLIIAAVAFLIFLLIRQINLWYWKINTSIALLTEIRALLRYNLPSEAVKKISDHFVSETPASPFWSKDGDDKLKTASPKSSNSDWLCQCGTSNPKNNPTCKNCGRIQNAVF